MSLQPWQPQQNQTVTVFLSLPSSTTPGEMETQLVDINYEETGILIKIFLYWYYIVFVQNFSLHAPERMSHRNGALGLPVHVPCAEGINKLTYQNHLLVGRGQGEPMSLQIFN